jgi:uncharacterized membrane protein
MRETLALPVLPIVGGNISLAVVCMALLPSRASAIKDFAVGVLPEPIVVLGMVMAFYFGSKRG